MFTGFIAWKLLITCYFLSLIGISLFSWSNIRFASFYSVLGITNFFIAILIKLA